MKKLLFIASVIISVIFVVLLMNQPSKMALKIESLPVTSSSEKILADKPIATPKEMPGVTVARTINETTGYAISPLLAAGVLGAYKYYSIDPDKRKGHVPWNLSPYFWIPMLTIGFLFMFHDLLGSWIPFLAKPMAAVENIEGKVTAVFVAVPCMASGVGIDLIHTVAQPLTSMLALQTGYNMAGFFIRPSVLISIILSLVFLSIAFFVVWLFIQAINALILISPFAPVDWMLNVFKYALLVILLVCALISPFFGLALALAIILLSWYISGWCFRLMIFGTVFAWDILTMKHREAYDNVSAIKAFTSCRMSNIPKRTYGHLSCNSQNVVFTYRRCLVFPRHITTLESSKCLIEKGLISPSIFLKTEYRSERLFILPPRYRTNEECVCELLKIFSTTDSKSVRGLRVGINWLKEMMSRRTIPANNRNAWQ